VDKPLATPLPRLFDLVRGRAPRLDVAFFLALRNTGLATVPEVRGNLNNNGDLTLREELRTMF
jgi:hypothetical protein